MSLDIEKDKSYYRPLPNPHPAVEKYHFSMADIHRHGMTYGIAPPTLFGILIGRIKSNVIIDSQMEKFLNKEDVQALNDDYDPLRHFQFIDLENSRNKYSVSQRYPAGMCKKGDGLRTDDGRWMIISDIEKTNTMVKIFSGGALVLSMSKSTLLTVAVAHRTYRPYLGDVEKATKKKTKKSTTKFFEEYKPDDFDYDEVYQTIYDQL